MQEEAEGGQMDQAGDPGSTTYKLGTWGNNRPLLSLSFLIQKVALTLTPPPPDPTLGL